MKYSYWDRTLIEEPVEVLIVGAGITGLSTAAALRPLLINGRIRVVDGLNQTRLASTRNAGFSCFGSPTELIEDFELQGIDDTLSLVEKRWKGMQLIKSRFDARAIDYRQCGGFELIPKSQMSKDELRHKLDEINTAIEPIVGSRPYVLDEYASNWPFSTEQHVVANALEGQLHPGKYTRELLRLCQAAGVEVWQGVRVNRIEKTGDNITLATSLGNMSASLVVLATNGHSHLLEGITIDMKPARNVVMVSDETNIPFQGVFHAERGYIYFRNIDGRLLIGGGRHWDADNEATDEFGRNQLIIERLEAYVGEVILPGYPKLTFGTQWSGILGFTSSKTPHIAKLQDRIYTAAGFGGMGVALGMQAGYEIADLIIKNES